MSYCRFQNTLKDLQDCFRNINNISSIDEAYSAIELYKLCQRFVDENELDDLKAELAELKREDAEFDDN